MLMLTSTSSAEASHILRSYLHLTPNPPSPPQPLHLARPTPSPSDRGEAFPSQQHRSRGCLARSEATSTPDNNMVFLVELPPEIIHHILGFVDPRDLAWIPRICQSFYHAVTGNTTLFRNVYLRHLDEPGLAADVDYEQLLKDTVHLQCLSREGSVAAKKNQLDFVHNTVTSLLKHAAPTTATYPSSRNAAILSSVFSDETNQCAFLCRSFIYERARREFARGRVFDDKVRAVHQKSAHLHCLYGVPMLFVHPGAVRTRNGKISPFACSKVYDLRQYTEKTKWGPFMDDDTDRVDWEKVEAIMIVLGSNLKKLNLHRLPHCKNFETPFAGSWAGSYKALPLNRELEPLELEDPYGVTGTWLRVVCFLDYNDFFAFNFTSEEQLPAHVPRPAIDVGEATRLILMLLEITKIEPPGPEDGQGLPVVHFKGVSRSLDDSFDDNANSDLRGYVRLTREGEVRWTTFSIFGGVERWRSESVQVGGVKSAKGVLGNWFDKDYDARGPAGPTAFWKISDGRVQDPTAPRFHNPAADVDIDDDDDGFDDEFDDDFGPGTHGLSDVEEEIVTLSFPVWDMGD
ncbi:hypothetical protein F4778DRAFT_744915 [Xylariomycetidae sp. FL2044]|nr:hypothetical protein F4778DRAFT_744915 [Xylariomycetidae sp. FL2044]